MADNRLIIFDTTLRDGEQAPGFSMNTPEKLRLARQLQTLGVDVLEVGFPIASSDDAEAVRLIAAEITGPIIAALARCNQADIECAAESVTSAERARIHTFIATSDLHAAASQLLQLAHRAFGCILQARQPFRVVEQDRARLGQPSPLGRPVEQPLAKLIFQPSNRLADGRLRAVQTGSGAREAALRGHRL